MADSMRFDLVTPEKSLASLQASAVDIPGAEGDMTAMPDHASLLTTLRPGFLRVQSDGPASEYLVTGGFVEITASSVSVLAETVVPKDEATREQVAEFTAAAEEELSKSSGAEKDLAEKRLGEFRALAATF
ncbi:MAG: F0F1 ATP synthase subunit epsilon [Albidovulum sp.]|nr:F0F1 ATP synthase subunit epsilon [Albidovulum sp.]